jgi:hypothetical protein
MNDVISVICIYCTRLAPRSESAWENHAVLHAVLGKDARSVGHAVFECGWTSAGARGARITTEGQKGHMGDWMQRIPTIILTMKILQAFINADDDEPFADARARCPWLHGLILANKVVSLVLLAEL